jgi:ATP-dependent RNA helicase DDX41
VPVAKRRAALLAQVGGRHLPQAKKVKLLSGDNSTQASREGSAALDAEAERQAADEAEMERVEREKTRREKTLLQAAQEVRRKKEIEGKIEIKVTVC